MLVKLSVEVNVVGEVMVIIIGGIIVSNSVVIFFDWFGFCVFFFFIFCEGIKNKFIVLSSCFGKFKV